MFTYDAIINEAGITLEKDVIHTEKNQDDPNNFLEFSEEELEKKLNEAINNEDYELASLIRDEINKRS